MPDDVFSKWAREDRDARGGDDEQKAFWLIKRNIQLKANYLTLLAVHGSLCLALRHPQFRGEIRPLVVAFTKSLGEWLVHVGALTPEQLLEVQKLEAEEGSEDLL